MDKKALEFSLARLEGKKELLFGRMQTLFDASKKITCFDYKLRSNDEFLIESGTIDSIRKEYSDVIEEIIQTHQLLESEYCPEYAALKAFEDIFIRVKGLRMKITDTIAATSVTGENSVFAEIKIPPINLPKFDGKLENWSVFYESFLSNIHQNRQLTDSQRVQYLIGCLSGDALRITAGIVPTGDTYKILWDGLLRKYQNKRVLGTYYLDNILNLKSCSHNANSLDAFIEKYSASILALKKLEIGDLTDFLLLQCALRKLDSQTVESFELSVRDLEIPTSQHLISFVQDKVKILERSNNMQSNPYSRVKNKSEDTSRDRRQFKSFVTRENSISSPKTPINGLCQFCNDSSHTRLKDCTRFKDLNDPKKRFEFVKSKGGCINCLNFNHSASSCWSLAGCKICNKRHHHLLHFMNINSHAGDVAKIASTHVVRPMLGKNFRSKKRSPKSASISGGKADAINSPAKDNKECIGPSNVSVPTTSSKTLFLGSKNNSTILLATIQAYARAKGDVENPALVRCLIDNGSQCHLITAECSEKLKLSVNPLINSSIKGIGNMSRPILGYVDFELESRLYPDKKYAIHALVVENITDQLPSQYINLGSDIDLKGFPLADMNWNIPGEIDIVLGAQLFPYIYIGDRLELDNRLPITVATTFGYVFMGDCQCNDSSEIESFTALTLHESLQKFWELEEIPKSHFLSPEETECENSYRLHQKRDESGRFFVSLPFHRDPSELGNSYHQAHLRLMNLEHKLRRCPALRESYNAVIHEYIENGYLSKVDHSQNSEFGYYIPHHAVTRIDKPMPRIVLDASAKSTTGYSLNDLLHPGPNLQADLFILLLMFRLFAVAMKADIRHMYLRIGINQEHQKYLRILFRFNECDTVDIFTFNRLPFGLKCSPYLAMRTVKQLASESKHIYAEAANVAETSLYMDDLVYSVDCEESAVQLAHDLIDMFKTAGFDLIKWSSNSSFLLNALLRSPEKLLEFGSHDNSQKILGLAWEPHSDNFHFTVSAISDVCTKRSILSVVARLFDVLGLVAPVILYAKLLIKELWLDKLGWDDPAPERIRTRFLSLSQEFSLLNSLRIPRHIGASPDCEFRIVAFCDASMNGYGSVIYAHCLCADRIKVKLLCAKSKVSPTKVTTLARLELCAALLMAKLVKVVREIYATRIPITGIYAFSDSTIALSWIHSSPHRWLTFVSNRVAQCQENLEMKHFYHISGVDNPSDCLSRGMLPSQLINHQLWWNGPAWMLQHPDEWPIKPFATSTAKDIPEQKTETFFMGSSEKVSILRELAQRVSSWEKLLRVVAYVLKFARPKLKVEPKSVQGLLYAEQAVLKAVQFYHFAEDIKAIKAGKPPSQKLRGLSVFIDEAGLLRIGGRLSNSDLPFEARHPFLLPKHDGVVDLIIRHYHVINCHTGPNLLLSILRQRFWPLDARSVVRSIWRKCNVCFRAQPSHFVPKMADLPACRVSETKAFVHTGVDYAGPLRIILTRRRGQHSQKAYICLFICLVTKALHIELVSDLTTDSFLSAFKRFISRRGPVSYLYSDNGTNFVGAKAKLNELHTFLLKSGFHSILSDELRQRRIEWKMIPPRAPHFGGIWEANIKGLKTHLYRIIGSQLLTYEELQTVVIQIECIMNSRPLTMMSSDPELEALTPAHFLMSTPFQYLPAQEIAEPRLDLVQRKKLLDAMVQSFWKRWHTEYLHSLQVRQKCLSSEKPAEVGTIVLLEL